MAFVIVKFPNKWYDTDYSEISKKYNVIIEKRNDRMFFFVNIDTDTNVLFDAIDEVIKYNKQIEEKATLFKKKTEELKNLFIKEPLELLETLTFTFETKKKVKNKKKIEKNVELNEEETSVPEEKNEVVEEINNNVVEVIDEVANKTELQATPRRVKKSDMLQFAENELC
jgi:hypothetical protein